MASTSIRISGIVAFTDGRVRALAVHYENGRIITNDDTENVLAMSVAAQNSAIADIFTALGINFEVASGNQGTLSDLTFIIAGLVANDDNSIDEFLGNYTRKAGIQLISNSLATWDKVETITGSMLTTILSKIGATEIDNTPESPSPILLFDARLGRTDSGDGTAVTAWADQSGNGNNVTKDASFACTLDNDGFNGLGTILSGGFTFDSTFTVTGPFTLYVIGNLSVAAFIGFGTDGEDQALTWDNVSAVLTSDFSFVTSLEYASTTGNLMSRIRRDASGDVYHHLTGFGVEQSMIEEAGPIPASFDFESVSGGTKISALYVYHEDTVATGNDAAIRAALTDVWGVDVG